MTPLVTTEWLASEMGAADLVILDASAHLPGTGRDPAAEYAAAHIPGARFLDLMGALVDPQGDVPAALPTRAQFEARMGALGVNADSRVVLYDNSDMRTSARAWFIFRLYGHPEFTILDGGMQKWVAEGRPVETGHASFDAADYVSTGGHGAVRSKADMLANCKSCVEQVVDARDAGRFAGTVEDTVHGLPGGHIPGARHLLFRDVLAEDGTFLPPAQIAEAFAKAGIDPDKPLAASCGSGVTASVLLFAHSLLGHDHGALYDGSWSDWGSDPNTPKETGEAA
ncbi:sulfurtransferase [Aurantiacibacter gilvus]|uniref:Sulfurtransferase n=1 Tax=Aurantiacibacter gilvus TaxID=3139141 RepID=A0ABU9IAY5_9SPHN